LDNNVNFDVNFIYDNVESELGNTDGKQSSKTKKAYMLMEKGHHIQIISEEEFYKCALNDAI
jgi:hypothetical protein